MTRFVSNSKSGQKYKNIHTKWPDLKRIQVYLPFPCHNVPNIILRLLIESLTCQFFVLGTHPLYTKRGILVRGNPFWGKPIRQIIFCNVYKYKLEGHIFLDYFLLKYMTGNHHSFQFIKTSFETNYIDQYKRIIEDASV